MGGGGVTLTRATYIALGVAEESRVEETPLDLTEKSSEMMQMVVGCMRDKTFVDERSGGGGVVC